MLTFSQHRQKWTPEVPSQLSDLTLLSFSKEQMKSKPFITTIFPSTGEQPLLKVAQGGKREGRALRMGALFSGGQAPGGHNVIAGLFDGLKRLHPNSLLFGFLGGPHALLSGAIKEITADLLAPYRNQGGFDLLGSGRDKFTEEQLAQVAVTVKQLQLDGLIIIGGDDSHTIAAQLAEYFVTHRVETKVVGVPKTIDGDLQSPYTAISFGFDTACKVYSEMIGNIARDALSAKKYYHFIKLMGRSASHITLECALATHPNLALIGEEILRDQKSLEQVVGQIADLICARSAQGKEYGILLIPEGVIEFIPDLKVLIQELNPLSALSQEEVEKKLSPASLRCFELLPKTIQEQLLLERDPHGNIQLSLIETERLFIANVTEELKRRKKTGKFQGKFSAQNHFLGYEGRAAFPSHFDSNYCYALGLVSALLVDEGATGYMSFITGLEKPPSEWKAGGFPIAALIDFEVRKGVNRPVIQKKLVDLEGSSFAYFASQRAHWSIADDYHYPGPIQFYGPKEVTDTHPHILQC